MFKPNRIFSTQNHKTGRPEWYFQAREGVVGPYETREQAVFMLKKFIKTCVELGYAGDREQENNGCVAGLHVQNFLHYEAKSDLNWV